MVEEEGLRSLLCGCEDCLCCWAKILTAPFTPRPRVQRCDSGCLEMELLVRWSGPKAERIDGGIYGVVAPPDAPLRDRHPQLSYVVGEVVLCQI
jgi:hypothetical protein